jgi:hypothetical protein
LAVRHAGPEPDEASNAWAGSGRTRGSIADLARDTARKLSVGGLIAARPGPLVAGETIVNVSGGLAIRGYGSAAALAPSRSPNALAGAWGFRGLRQVYLSYGRFVKDRAGRFSSEGGFLLMAMYVYSTGGQPIGFLYETFVHDLDGRPLGRILGSRVHRLDGSYAGEWFKEMVVERPTARPRAIPPVTAPPLRPSPGTGMQRRAVVDYGFPDAFDRLREPAVDSGAAFREAAE